MLHLQAVNLFRSCFPIKNIFKENFPKLILENILFHVDIVNVKFQMTLLYKIFHENISVNENYEKYRSFNICFIKAERIYKYIYEPETYATFNLSL